MKAKDYYQKDLDTLLDYIEENALESSREDDLQEIKEFFEVNGELEYNQFLNQLKTRYGNVLEYSRHIISKEDIRHGGAKSSPENIISLFSNIVVLLGFVSAIGYLFHFWEYDKIYSILLFIGISLSSVLFWSFLNLFVNISDNIRRILRQFPAWK